MLYTVGEAAKEIGVATSTLRYYDKEGILPFVERSEAGRRMFSESDVEWLRVIECLKKTGMPLHDIKGYVQLAMEGDSTLEARLELIRKRQAVVREQLDQLKETMELLNYKEWYYEQACADGTCDNVNSLSDKDVPAKFRKARRKFKGQ